jgi:hypothetical protein
MSAVPKSLKFLQNIQEVELVGELVFAAQKGVQN